MATSYPGTVDSFTNPVSTDALSSPAHASQHANVNDAIEAIEATLGVNPQGGFSTVAARMGSVDAQAAAAASSAAAAAVSASSASSSAVATAADALSAANSASLASAVYADFDKRYLGPKATAPSVDNQGNALVAGALYWNTVTPAMYVWTGSAWILAVNSVYAWSGPVTIADNSSNTALRVTQTGSGNAFVVEDSANPDTTPFVIDAAGNVSTYGAVSGASFTATAGVSAGSVNASGAVSAATASVSGSVSAGTFYTAGTATAGRFVGSGAVRNVTSSTRPGSPAAGDLIYETDTTLYYGWNGTAWAPIGGSSGGGAGYQDIFLMMGA